MKARPEALENIAGKTFDVCVIGGGATGAGCALDAQLRGLNTVLVDGGDFASATSSASTKLIHGGVRYLQQAVTRLDLSQYRVVKRALRERSLMMRNAPFLARTSTEVGGEALNHARVIGFDKGPGGKLVAAKLEDSRSRRRFTLQARAF